MRRNSVRGCRCRSSLDYLLPCDVRILRQHAQRGTTWSASWTCFSTSAGCHPCCRTACAVAWLHPAPRVLNGPGLGVGAAAPVERGFAPRTLSGPGCGGAAPAVRGLPAIQRARRCGKSVIDILPSYKLRPATRRAPPGLRVRPRQRATPGFRVRLNQRGAADLPTKSASDQSRRQRDRARRAWSVQAQE